MSEMLGKLVTMLSVDHILSPEAAEIVEHVTLLETIADQTRKREMNMVIQVDTAPMTAAVEKIRGELETTIFNFAKANGYTMPPPGSEWIPVDRISELEPREGVIVTDGKSWGLAKYNEHRAKTGNPFPVVYEVAESMHIMDDITHFRRLTAVALPDGSLMVDPQPVILKRNTMNCPDCKHRFMWEQAHGMRLYQPVKVNGKEVEAYKARCPECHTDHWVRR